MDRGFLIFICDKCKRPAIAFAYQSSKTCPFCGRKIKISGSNVIAKTGSSVEARNIVAKHKEAWRRRNTRERT